MSYLMRFVELHRAPFSRPWPEANDNSFRLPNHLDVGQAHARLETEEGRTELARLIVGSASREDFLKHRESARSVLANHL